jgi:hypothetical protein
VQEWHDINDPGFLKIAKPQEASAPKGYVTDATIMPPKDTADEVKLSEPKFLEGEEGFEFNKKCSVRVKVDYLKETFRKKVTFSLFSDYKGEVQDMHHTVDGDEESGVAEAPVTLYFNDAHYPDYCSDPSTTVDYFFKATHPRGKEIESPRLTMPHVEDKAKRVRLVGMLFDANKCFLLPQGLPGIKAIIEMHQKCPDAAVLIVGHAGGDEDLAGLDMALDRADMLAAYLTSKPEAWLDWFSPKKETRVRWGTREMQLMLSALPEGQEPFYKGNAPGITDASTIKAIKEFQKYSNENLGTKLAVDGKAGPETRKALVNAYMDIEDTTLSGDIVPTTHGCEGHFDDTLTEDGLQPDDRKIEVFFFEKSIEPAPEGKTSEEGAADYPAWLSQVTETDDFEYHGINVQIVDAKKRPVPLAKVNLTGPTEQEAMSDGYGYVSFSDLKAGEYTVHSEKDGYKIKDSKITYPTAKTVNGHAPRKNKKNT